MKASKIDRMIRALARRKNDISAHMNYDRMIIGGEEVSIEQHEKKQWIATRDVKNLTRKLEENGVKTGDLK